MWWCRCSAPRGCKASEYVVFDAEDEPPGASSNGAASGTFRLEHAAESRTHRRVTAFSLVLGTQLIIIKKNLPFWANAEWQL